MAHSAIVLGAGMVGASVALHLALRGVEVTLLDRGAPGSGATYGNAGMIQREAVEPAAFPRAMSELARIAGNRAIDVRYDPLALAQFAPALLRYWRNSAPDRYAAIVRSYAAMIRECLNEHRALAVESGAETMLRPVGYLRVFEERANLDAMALTADRLRREFGVAHRVLDGEALAAEEPTLLRRLAGALHWSDPYSLSDPQALTQRHVDRLVALGGRFLRGEAATLRRSGKGWSVQAEAGAVEAGAVVIALGAAATDLTRRFGYVAPTFPKRGYHRHFRLPDGAALRRAILHHEKRVMLAPMRGAVRLTTGVEFARPGAPATPIQLKRAEPVARTLLALGEAIEPTPWHGLRPACADMLPVIGPIPRQPGLWAAFGHGHQGLTLGPATGRLLAELFLGERPFVDHRPFDPARFA